MKDVVIDSQSVGELTRDEHSKYKLDSDFNNKVLFVLIKQEK